MQVTPEQAKRMIQESATISAATMLADRCLLKRPIDEKRWNVCIIALRGNK